MSEGEKRPLEAKGCFFFANLENGHHTILRCIVHVTEPAVEGNANLWSYVGSLESGTQGRGRWLSAPTGEGRRAC